MFKVLSSIIALCTCSSLLGWSATAYEVRRNVKDFGAVGDGVTDDSDAIIRAMTQDRSDTPGMTFGAGAVYSSSTQTPGMVFFPAGTYRISKTIPLIYYSQMVGDVDSMPVLKMVSEIPLRLIDALDVAWGGNLVNQNNFYHQIRNLVLDMTECDQCTGIHWQVAQATQISNVIFKMNPGSSSQGIWMDNGSGGFISDLVFEGGMYGMWVGNQQFTSRNITIRGASLAGVYLNWDWGWTFKNTVVEDTPVAFDLGYEAGTLTLLDCTFSNVSVAGVRSKFSSAASAKQQQEQQEKVGQVQSVQSNDVLIDNLVFDATVPGSSNVIVLNSPSSESGGGGEDVVALSGEGEGQVSLVQAWVQGMVWLADGTQRVTTMDLAAEGSAPPKPQSLLGAASEARQTKLGQQEASIFFEKSRPVLDSAVLFTQVNAVTELGIANDGVTDVTADLQSALNKLAGMNTAAADVKKSVLFLPSGSYLISDTVFVPPGALVLGEVWSNIVVSGSAFQDASKPLPALMVGDSPTSSFARLAEGSGAAEAVRAWRQRKQSEKLFSSYAPIQLVDLMITTKGPQAGAKLLEWNQPAASSGRSADDQVEVSGLWEVHFRVGGAIGTEIDKFNCPRGDGSSAPAAECTGSWALMHVTGSGSGYFENVWGWVADHDLDYDDQINVYNSRGFLCESSEGPVWMYGTSFEHNILYQYNFVGAKNVLMGMIQTETPYFQPSIQTPFPRASGEEGVDLVTTESDPQFCSVSSDERCAMSLALHIAEGSEDVLLYGAGLYSFFRSWDQNCLQSGAGPNCQLELNKVDASSSAWLLNTNTYGSEFMFTQQEKAGAGYAATNANNFCSTVAADLLHTAAGIAGATTA